MFTRQVRVFDPSRWWRASPFIGSREFTFTTRLNTASETKRLPGNTNIDWYLLLRAQETWKDVPDADHEQSIINEIVNNVEAIRFDSRLRLKRNDDQLPTATVSSKHLCSSLYHRGIRYGTF